MFKGMKALKIFSILLIVGVLCWQGAYDNALADNIRPAYLDIEEFESGTIRIVWKVPLYQRTPDRFTPSFPEYFKVSSPRRRLVTRDAIIEKWDMVCGKGGLAGARIGIDGLEQTMTDALVRIQLADGSVHRVVLRPTERVTTVPSSKVMLNKQEGVIRSGLRIVDRWRYALLLPAALLLSLLRGPRRRGIILCTVALVAGALCGHGVGRLPIYDKVLNQNLPPDMEVRRIIQGLMLNTYRAFMLQTDEETYDYLARSVAGEFLSEVYLQNREVMRIDRTEGAMTIIDRLDVKSIESIKRLKDGVLSVVANWDVYGSVRHLKHIHYRCNTYKAELTIVPTENYWKLTNVQLLNEQRVI